MNRITKRSTKNLLVLTIVATIAAIFMIPAGLANASHAESFGTLTKTTTCADMTQFVQATCTINVTWDSLDDNSDRIVETIPAGFSITPAALIDLADNHPECTVKASNEPKQGKSNKGVGTTKVDCKATDLDITVDTESRTTKKGKQKPTSCDEPFDTNGGVTVTQLDANMEVVLVPSHNEAGEFLDEGGNVVFTEEEAALVPSTMSAPEESADVTCAV
jgi:hypothetical protein